MVNIIAKAYARRNRRFKGHETHAASIFGEKLAEIWTDPMVLFDGHQAHVTVWRLKSGRFLVINERQDCWEARLTTDEPCHPGQFWTRDDYIEVCAAVGMVFDDHSALFDDEELERDRAAYGMRPLEKSRGVALTLGRAGRLVEIESK